MSRREITRTLDLVMRKWGPLVDQAALAFEARWTVRALRFHNPKLAEAFEGAVADYGAAMDSGTSTEIEATAGRLCRAYAAVSAELASAKVSDEAYVIGEAESGLRVAISATPAAGRRAQEVHGGDVVWFSPAEIASIIELHAEKIFAVKAAFPGSQIAALRTKEHP